MLNYVKPSKMTAKIQDLNIVSASKTWAAAAYAQRINGEYLKPERSGYQTVAEDDDRVANRFIMQKAMFYNLQPELTEEDYLHGQAARDHHSKKLMMSTFKRELSDFERTLSRAVGMECFTKTDRYELAVIASQIASYERDMREQEIIGDREQIGYVADVGSRVEFTATVIRKDYNFNYNTYRVRAITQDGYRIQFYFRHDDVRSGDTVRFKGTVKKHLDNTTYFNRVNKAKQNGRQ